jgi:hypothetical protein
MAVIVSCQCGKKLRVKEELAGKRVRCPGCAAVVMVPAADEPVEVEKERARPAAPPQRAARAPARPEPEEDDEAPRGEAEEGDEARSFWTQGGKLLALSDEAIYVARLDEKQMRKARAALKQGTPVAEVLEEPDTVIPFEAVKKVEGNLYHEFIEVTWREAKASEDTETTIWSDTKEDRDEFVAELRQRLGPDWKREVKEFGRLRAAVAPLIVVGFFSFGTFCFYMAGAHPEDDKSGSGGKTVRTNIIGAIFVWVYNLLGPIAVAVLGGLCILAGVAWLVARLIKPPIMLTLTPKEAPRRKKRR